jgi:hypothetical protein
MSDLRQALGLLKSTIWARKFTLGFLPELNCQKSEVDDAEAAVLAIFETRERDFTANITDYKALAQKLVNALVVTRDALASEGYGCDADVVLKEAKELGLEVKQ